MIPEQVDEEHFVPSERIVAGIEHCFGTGRWTKSGTAVKEVIVHPCDAGNDEIDGDEIDVDWSTEEDGSDRTIGGRRIGLRVDVIDLIASADDCGAIIELDELWRSVAAEDCGAIIDLDDL